MIPISPYFNVQSRREMDTLASFYAILLTLRPFCAFRENLWVLLAKIAFWRIEEKSRGSRKPGTLRTRQNAQMGGGTDGHQGTRTGARKPRTTSRPATWHGRAMCAPPGVNLFRDSFFGASFHSAFFPLFFLLLLGFLESGLRESKHLDLV